MTHINFLGIPVEGNILHPAKRQKQLPLSALEPILRAVLDDEFIHSLGWSQNTPYFNDGDPCVFGVNELWIKTVEDNPEDEDYGSLDCFAMYNHPTLGSRDWTGVTSETGRVYEYSGPNEDRFNRCNYLADAIEGGSFDNVLLEAFGDHAEITIKRSGITVEQYSHD